MNGCTRWNLSLFPVCLLAAVFACGVLAAAPASPRVQLHVEAFGAVGDGIHDDGPALRAAADALADSSVPASLHFGYGRTYRMAAEAFAHGAIVFQRVSNLIIEGNGSTLLNHPDNRTLVLYRCDNVTVRNLTLDLDPAPFAQGRIVALYPEENALEVLIDPGYVLPATGTFNDSTQNDVMLYHRETRDPITVFSRKREVLQLGERLFRLDFFNDRLVNRAVVGDFITMKTAGEGNSLQDADGSFIVYPAGPIIITSSHHVTLEDVTSYASQGMTVRATASDHLVLRRFNMLRKPGSNRLIASNKDGLHLKNFRVPPVIEDSRLETGMDDTINLTQPTSSIRTIRSRTEVEIGDDDVSWHNLNVATGDDLLYFRANERFFSEHRVIAVEWINRRRAWVTLEPELPEGIRTGDTFALKPLAPAYIRRLEIPPTFQRDLLVRMPALIEDVRQSGGARFLASFAGDREGPPPYEQIYLRGFAINPGAGLQFDLEAVPNRPGQFSAIIRDSIIGRAAVDSVPVRFGATDGVTFAGNRMVYPEPSTAAAFSTRLGAVNTEAFDNQSIVAAFGNRETDMQISPTYRFGGLLGNAGWHLQAGADGVEIIGGEITGVATHELLTLENNDIWMHGHILQRIIAVVRLSVPGEAVLRWQTEDANYSDKRQLRAHAAAAAGLQTLVFETAAHADWPTAWIRGLQLILPARPGERFAVRYVALSAGDADRDGIHDLLEGSADVDGDGLPNMLDRDADGDGIPDSVEGNRDTLGNGLADRLSPDSSGDGVPDAFHWQRFGHNPQLPAPAAAAYFGAVLGDRPWPLDLVADPGSLSFRISGELLAGRSIEIQQSADLQHWHTTEWIAAAAQERRIERDFAAQPLPGFMRALIAMDASGVLAHDSFLQSPSMLHDGGGRGFSGGFRPYRLNNGGFSAMPGLTHPLKRGIGDSVGLTLFGPQLSDIRILRGVDLAAAVAFSSNGVDIDSGTLYLAWLYQPAQSSGSFLDRLALLNSGVEVLGLRFQQNHPDYRLEGGALEQPTGVQPQAGRTDLIILRLDFDRHSEDRLRVYINPDSYAEPEQANAELRGRFAFRELALIRLSQTGSSQWDEFSLSSSFIGALNGIIP